MYKTSRVVIDITYDADDLRYHDIPTRKWEWNTMIRSYWDTLNIEVNIETSGDRHLILDHYNTIQERITIANKIIANANTNDVATSVETSVENVDNSIVKP